MATLRTNIWVAAITGAVGLGGALIGGSFSMAGTREAADAAAEAQERDLRRVAYLEYLDALDTYAAADTSRSESCVYDTDERLASNVPCHPSLAEYRDSKDLFEGERNDMELIASDEALLLVTAIEPTVLLNVGPPSEQGFPDPRSVRYRSLYSAFLELAACDTSPNPRETCSYTRTHSRDVVMDFSWIRELLTGERSDTGPTDELRELLRSWPEAGTAPD
jgi:hypothetical protein